MAERVLCVEDDPDIGRLLVAILGEAGYPADWVTDGNQTLACWSQASLILLDLMLPGVDGLTVCGEIRSQDAAVPLIMLTAKASTRDVVRRLERGADDYITKPFDVPILLARIQALLRRRSHRLLAADALTNKPPIVFGDLAVDLDKHRATLAGQPV